MLIGSVVALGYRWIGILSPFIGILSFILYELWIPPPQHRLFGWGQSKEAVDNKFGHFGGSYEENAPVSDIKKIGRNAPCPCGSGSKYKHCHGKAPTSL